MLKKSVLPIIILVSLLLSGCTDKKQDDVSKANEIISSNEYLLRGLDDTEYMVKKGQDGFNLENKKDKIIIFDIFATWCPPCQKGASHLSSLQEKYKDNLVVIGVTIEENLPNSKLLDFRKQFDAKYILVNSKQNRPLADAIATQLKLGKRFPIPVVAMYKNGKLIKHYVGRINEEFIQSDINIALGK